MQQQCFKADVKTLSDITCGKIIAFLDDKVNFQLQVSTVLG